MQERGYHYSRANEFDVSRVVPNNTARLLVNRADTAIAQINTVLQNDSYLDRKKKLVTEERTFAGSEAFRLDYDPSISREALYEDIVSYLGEYRFEVPEYKYKQRFSRSTDDGSLRLYGEKDNTPMLVMGEKAIADKLQNGETIEKVRADFLGMQRVEKLLSEAKTGDRILYASPPDPEYGYTYGFFYDGKVEELQDGEKILHLRALRIDEASDLDAFNTALSAITGRQANHATPNQFIENPEHITQAISDKEINKILRSVFQFDTDARHERRFKSNIEQMQPYIAGVIDLIKNGAPLAQLQQSFHALENLAIKLKESSSEETVVFTGTSASKADFDNFVDKFGYQPPKVAGSCGSSGGRSSNNVFGTGSIFSGATKGAASSGEDEYGSLEFKCPFEHLNTRPRGQLIPNCGTCGVSVSC
jgi:hypothetical protein